jgi:hypothetical protein
VGPAALLHATLQDLLAVMNRMREGGAFFDGVGDRLFQVNIFACRQGIARHAYVPVIGSGNEHRVYILGQHFVIIEMGRSSSGGGDPCLHLIAARPIHIAYSDDLVGDAAFVGGIENGSHAAAGSDDSDAKDVVRTQDFGLGKGSKSACDEEAAAIRLKGHGAPRQFVPDDLNSEIHRAARRKQDGYPSGVGIGRRLP